jgi:DNA-directed RNA polymerase subunit RPC12/RpoP
MADTLFTFDDEHVVNNGPVTCLGIVFESDEKRREYFREELRKKLPDLRLLEGFPIGSDDDIVALSDPPYYTACPNPWIKDFIDEWEVEKGKLESMGKRSSSFVVKEPYATDVSEGRSNPIYLAHTYHTKVPHPAIMKYILHYTQPGDIVFDGFAGTGMTGVAAHKCGTSEARALCQQQKNTVEGERHAVCSDLSPIATFIAYNYNSPQNPVSFKRRALSIIKKVEDAIGWMYETKHYDGRVGKINYVVWSDVYVCPNCGNEFSFYDVAVDDDNQKIRDSFQCPHCGSVHTKKTVTNATESYYDDVLGESLIRLKTIPASIKYQTPDNKYHKKRPDTNDLELLRKIEQMPLPYWVPSDQLPIGFNTEQPRNAHITHVHHMYTRRNLYVASCIKDAIGDDVLLNVLLTSYLNARGTKMTRYKLEKAGNAILNGTMYIAAVTAEQNLFDGFKGKVDDLFKAYDATAKNLVSIASATSLPIPDNSIDYIFTDPPFGGNIMYSELNFVNEAWLKVRTNNTEEAIINKTQNKDLFSYQALMNSSLKEYYRVLKPDKWLTMEFSNTSAAVWNSIQNALQGVGFIVVNVAGLDKQQGSFKAYTSPTAVKQDLIITCYKPSEAFVKRFTATVGSMSNVWDFVEDVLEHLPTHLMKNDATTAIADRSPKVLFDRLIAYYVQHGYQVPIDAADFQKGLKERFVERDGMYFTAEQAIEYEEKKKETTSFVSLALLVGSEAEGIEWLRRKLEERPKMYSEILPDWMQDLVKPKKGDTLPELMQILDENFLKDERGYWHIPDLNDQAQLDAIKTKRLLREFEVYVEAKRVKNARLEALRAGFKECYKNKDFATIIAVGDKIEEELLTTDEVLLRFYDIASSRV